MRLFPARPVRTRALALFLTVGLSASLQAAPGCISTGSTSFSSGASFDVEIDGTTPCTGHDQIQVTGSVSIDTNADLNITGAHAAAIGDVLVLIDNDGADAITGNFKDLPETAVIANFLSSGHQARVSYLGGDGNDMQLTVEATVNNEPIISAIAVNDVTTSGDTDHTIIITYTDDSQVLDAGISVGNISVTGPGGTLLITGAFTDAPEDVSPKIATYIVTPPGGTWDAADNGTYTIGMFDGQVGDDGALQLFVAANPNAATFEVSIVPEIAVSGDAVDIVDGDSTPDLLDHTDFGGALLVGGTVVRAFTIGNNGGAALTLTGATPVTLSGTNAADFRVVAQPTSPVFVGASVNFSIEYDPSADGLRSAIVSIVSNDADEGVFDFAIHGTTAFPTRISEVGTDGDPGIDAARPATAYNPLAQQFLVVWDQPDGI